MMPTTSEPPITKCPKVSITLPAYPLSRTSRLALTFRASRKRVATRIIAGNAEKSSGRCTNIEVSSTSRAAVMLNAISTSRSTAGSGTTSITTMPTTATGTPITAARPVGRVLEPGWVCATVHLSAASGGVEAVSVGGHRPWC